MRTVKIAVPLADGRLTNHFGHCASFALVDADADAASVVGRADVEAPPHEPGLLPRWLGDKGVTHVIAGGMGSRARTLFEERGIKVVTGAPCLEPEQLVESFLKGTLETGTNACDH